MIKLNVIDMQMNEGKRIWIQRLFIYMSFGVFIYGVNASNNIVIAISLIVFGGELLVFSKSYNEKWAKSYKMQPTRYTRMFIILGGLAFLIFGLIDLFR